MYDAVMDRVARWVPELKDQFERAAAKAEERAAADKPQREEQWASAKASRRSTSAPPSFGRKCPSKALCRGCVIDGVHLECSFSTRVPGGKAMVTNGTTRCLLCSETRLKSHVAWGIMLGAQQLKTFYAWREEHPAVYGAAMDRIIRWVPQLKDNFERVAAKRTPSRLCRGCDIDGVHVECSFSTRVPGGKASVLPNTNCLLCSETCLRMLGKRSIWPIARSFKAYCAWREEHPAVYDAAMDRVIRWVPQLKDSFERVAAKAEVNHKPPAQGSVKGNTRVPKRKHAGT